LLANYQEFIFVANFLNRKDMPDTWLLAPRLIYREPESRRGPTSDEIWINQDKGLLNSNTELSVAYEAVQGVARSTNQKSLGGAAQRGGTDHSINSATEKSTIDGLQIALPLVKVHPRKPTTLTTTV
jgi:hypothetical protein